MIHVSIIDVLNSLAIVCITFLITRLILFKPLYNTLTVRKNSFNKARQLLLIKKNKILGLYRSYQAKINNLKEQIMMYVKVQEESEGVHDDRRDYPHKKKLNRQPKKISHKVNYDNVIKEAAHTILEKISIKAEYQKKGRK